MKHKYSFLLAVVLICASIVLISCRSARVRRTSSREHEHVYVQGPPPHAPAHGYRHKHQGVDLVYDSGLGVYVVVDFPNHFYFEGHFYRHRGDRWEISVHVDGPWEVVAEKSLPKGLRSKKKGKAEPKGPPPHAPAHGYRHKYQEHGVELVYDSGLGVYVVVDLADHYYFKGNYYHHRENQWEIGVHVDGPWKVVAEKSLPKGLRSKKKDKGKPKGPPPHAPVQGYRHNYQEHGVELVYDSGLGVYVVVDLADHYYFEGHYYRHRENQWEIGVHVDGPWKVVAEKSLPKGLRNKEKGKGKGKGKPKEHPGKGLGLEKKKN